MHHPLWPALLAGASRVLGEAVGLHALGLVGVVVAAAAAWLLAAEIDPRASRGAFWLVAASPVAVNGLILWAHAPSAAAAGVALLAAVRLGRDGPTVGRLVSLALAVVAGVLLRSEGLLLAGAVAVTMVIVARRVRLVTALPLVAGAVAWLAERRWVAGIVEGYAAPERTGGAGQPRRRSRPRRGARAVRRVVPGAPHRRVVAHRRARAGSARHQGSAGF